jgi:hypothetical protein
MPRLNTPLTAALLCALAALASCGTGAELDAPAATDSYRQASYNPMAPTIHLTPLEQALADAPGLRLPGGRRLVALDALNRPAADVQSKLRVKEENGGLVISMTQPLASAALYLSYDGSKEHVAWSEVARPDGLSMTVQARPGLLALGAAAYGRSTLSPRWPLASVRFAAGADTALHVPAKVNTSPFSKVSDLTAVDGADSTATLQWSERNTGDYDLNSEVNIADITPVGANFKETYVDSSSPGYAELEVIDGDGNKEINIAELTPIGANFGTVVKGYDVYRTPLSAPDEIPDENDSGRWTKVPNDAEPAGPSIPRDWNGQKFRLVYVFHDASGDGDFGWYVSPVGLEGDNLSAAPKSNVATVTVTPGGPPPAGLSFEIQSPATESVAVDEEFYLAVKVNDVIGLFSANVRFEYDASLVQLLESVDTYTGHPNFLEPPLFLAVDDVGAATDPYVLLGFNATQTQGTAVKDGSGALGYFRFKALAAGANLECFRFPQATNFIYLWGVDYGVPVATPGLGSPQALDITAP